MVDILSGSALALGQPPGVGVAVALVEGVQLLVALLPREAQLVGELEEVGGDVDEPLRVDRAHLPHVLLRGEDQLVVDHPLRLLVEQRAARVDVDLVVVDQGAVPALRVLPSSVEEEPGDDGLPDERVVFAAGFDREAVPLQQLQELLPHVLRSSQAALLDEVLLGPGRTVALVPPGLEDFQVGEVVAFKVVELGLLLVGHRLLLLGPVEDVLHREHSDDGDDLLRAGEVNGGEQHLGEGWLEGELSHLPAQFGQQSLVVERGEVVELLEGDDEGLDWRGIHEVEVDEVVDAHGLQLQDSIRQIGPLDLGDRSRQHLVLVGLLSINSIAFTRTRPASSSRPLLGTGLRNGSNNQRVHSEFGVVDFDLREAGIDHVEDAVDGQAGLGNVGGDDALPLAGRGGFEDPALEFTGQCTVDRQDDQFGNLVAEPAQSFVQDLAGGVDFLLAREEQEHVSGRLVDVDLHDAHEGGVEVVGLGLLGVEDLHVVGPAGDAEDLAVVEVAGELAGLEGGRGDDEEEVLPLLGHLLEDAEEDVGVDGPLVGLVEHDHRVLAEVLVNQCLPQQHSVGHVLDDGLAGGVVLESDRVAHFVAHLHVHLLAHSLGHAHRRHSSRLRAPDLAALVESRFVEVLSDLRGLAAAGFSNDNEHVVVVAGLNELLLVLEDGEGLLLLAERHVAGLEVLSRLGLLGSHLVQELVQVADFVFVLLFADFSSLLGVLKRVHGLPVESALWVLDDSDGGEVDACLGGLPGEEGRLSIIDLDIDVLDFLIGVSPGLLGDDAHVGQSADLPLVVVGVASFLVHCVLVLDLDACEPADVARHRFLLEDKFFLLLDLLLVELLAVVLVHLLHAQPHPVLENLQNLDPNKQSFLHDFGDVLCGLLSHMAGVDDGGLAIDDVEDMNEAAHFVDLRYLAFIDLAHLQGLDLWTTVLLLLTFLHVFVLLVLLLRS